MKKVEVDIEEYGSPWKENKNNFFKKDTLYPSVWV